MKLPWPAFLGLVLIVFVVTFVLTLTLFVALA